MNRRRKTARKPAEKKPKRLLEAEDSFRKMQQEIAPFVKRRGVLKESTTAGKWELGSSLSRRMD